MKKFLLGLVLSLCSIASWAVSFTDLKFGQYQIADSQWDVGACLYTSTCNIYYTQPGTMYTIPWYNGQWSWQAGQYVKFSLSGNSSYPYTANVYNSNGTLAGTVGTGKIINMGVDSNGYALFFFVGNDDNTGQLFSANYGMTGNSGYSWTGTLNPTLSQVDSFANSYGSTSPLASGQTYTATPTPSGPTITGGTITQTNSPGTEVITSGSSSTAGPSNAQTTSQTNWSTNANPSNVNNYLYIDQVSGNYNSVTITQSGSKNTMYLGLNGSSNTVSADQTGTNYLNGLVQGTQNQLTSSQSNTAGSNYQETKIMSNTYTGNTINATQIGNGNNLMFNTINGSNNTITASQSGSGNHYLENKLTGNGNTVLSSQTGSTGNNANVDLTNAGGPASLDLQQSGGKNFTIIQSCTNPAGCTTVIRQ
jgi:hypothetical protein